MLVVFFMLSEFNHVITGDGPGSRWKPALGDRQIFHDRPCTVGDLLSDSHYDVFVRYGYAHALVNGNMDENYRFWRSFYTKMQNRRVGTVKVSEFDCLIENFEKCGFKNIETIPVDENYEILDGSHRLACSALFNAFPHVSIFNKKSHTYDKSWFEKNDFSAEELQQADKVRLFLYDKFKGADQDSFVAIVWGMALEHWGEIFSHLQPSTIRRAFIKDFKDRIEEFVMQSYEADGMSCNHLTKKANRLAANSSMAGLIILNDNLENIKSLKMEVRGKLSATIENYFFDCIIHVIDDKKAGLPFYDKYKINK